MRYLTHHQVPGAANDFSIAVTDKPGAGGANHRYEITGFNTNGNDSRQHGDPFETLTILFQNGPVHSNGMNGVTLETLLAICADRLEGFQSGPFPSDSNQLALEKIHAALEALHSRTRARIARSVEGKAVA